MKSFALLRTNPGLTTNIKVIVASDYSLYLESFDSVEQLSLSRYKKFQFSKYHYYDELLSYFYNNKDSGPTSADIAFTVKFDNDQDKMYNDFSKQYDDIYQMGCRNISDNKDYTEQFECIAPLYLFANHVPKYFIILRVDGTGLEKLDSTNFRQNIIDNFKCVKLVDLTKKTPIGEWIDTNFTSNPSYPKTPFELDFRQLEFSTWNGIDYDTGGYSSLSFFLDDTLGTENIFYDLNKTVYDGYKNNKIVFPNIINFSFLFDDAPATPTSLRKWSINRYYGFYLEDLEEEFSVSPYIPPALKPDIIVSPGNILSSLSNSNPFVKDFNSSLIYYVEYLGNFYEVQQYQEASAPIKTTVRVGNVITDTVASVPINKYRIISDLDLSGKQSLLNNNIISIDSNNNISLINGATFSIPNYDNADLWLININDINHVIQKNDNNQYYIQTDYGFQISIDKFSYYVNDPDPNYRTDVSLLIDSATPPVTFQIFRAKFSDIKDFDTKITETEYAKFEYDIDTQLVSTDETKLYVTDLRSTANPKDLDDFKLNDVVVNIPCASEFTATGELFEVVPNESNGDLSDIWRKNPVFCKWGFQNSLSANDYPYYLNNSTHGEDHNRTANPFLAQPVRVERNLDYFYSIDSGTTSYTHQTLNIDGDNFDLNKYLGFESYGTASYNYDYFSYFFGQKSYYDNGNIVKNVTKYSNVNAGDTSIANSTLFRGIKFNIFDVGTIKPGVNSISNINLIPSDNYDDYQFTILLNSNNYQFEYDSVDTSSIIGITNSINSMTWSIADHWKMDQNYFAGDIVVYYDILYVAISDNITSDPLSNPSNSLNWQLQTSSFTDYIFWSPNIDYSFATTGKLNFVYNNYEYYLRTPNTGVDFWTPGVSYGSGSFSIFQNYVWVSTVNNNIQQPSDTLSSGGTQSNWIKTVTVAATASNCNWDIIRLWNPSVTYNAGTDFVVYQDVLYVANAQSSGEIPGSNNFWTRLYSIVPDTTFVYQPTGWVNNNIIFMNNKYYIITGNSSSSTLDNGINIYINNIWKNILINIYINDNTTPNISGVARDVMYNDINSKLTANNFINAINDINDTYGFSDTVNYIIINTTGINLYNINNIDNLPTMVIAEFPDIVNIKIDSILTKPSTINPNLITPSRKLDNGLIVGLNQLDHYNDLPLGTEITKVKKERPIVDNESGLKNQVYNNLYRYSGYYMPIFYEIQLFQRPGEYGPLPIGNYKFDTDLTEFGIIKERIMSKINTKGSVLKLRNNTSHLKSVYPMLDEFGYTFMDTFIFKSNWDYEYYYECVAPPIIDVTNQLINNNISNTQ